MWMIASSHRKILRLFGERRTDSEREKERDRQ
jgi:hypothetical protein